ncbi:uncharacterized protein LOC118442502 [Vespa mandarinia]|uniref:uncharacterized protein LOC118442502 n=1 Tax=Vespa mandarinia TaxID=7446 RepID=UPI0016142B28|nr:uncharacterized protein LOC118442502 [Vespa mandarinia]
MIQAYLYARYGCKTPGEAAKAKAERCSEGSGGSGRPPVFRSGLSTIHAVQEVVTAAKMMERGNHRTRSLCLLATLDVRNAFNSVRWDLAREALERNFGVPKYPLRIIDDYLNERCLVYNTSDGPRSLESTSGAAHGSILVPDICNIFYDGIFRMAVPEGTFLVGYADDIAIVITARDTEGAQLLLKQVMRRVPSWMEDHGLFLAAQKTERVLITWTRINTLRSFIVGNAAVQTNSAVKYFGVMLNNKLNYGEHINRAADKAAKVVASLGMLMANVNGPRPCMRRLLMRAAEVVMLYGAEVWAETLRKQKYRKRIAAVQRRGDHQIACSYRKVSEPAVLVVAGVIPIDLLAQERKFVYQQRCILGKERASRLARSIIIKACQSRWEQERRGRWTARFISQLDTWINREAGVVDFYLTEFLTWPVPILPG